MLRIQEKKKECKHLQCEDILCFILCSPYKNKTPGNILQDDSWVLFFLIYDKGVMYNLAGTKSKEIIEMK